MLSFVQVTGIMYFSVKMASRLLNFHTVPPLDACTYMGLDSGASPLEVSAQHNCDPLSENQPYAPLA